MPDANQQKMRIMFVDDDPAVLNGLENMFRIMRNVWDMAFVSSGRKALELMKQSPVDIVISDMRMPEMDGVQLLEAVKRQYPGTIRFILSGHSDRDMILKSVGMTHQFLAKPCDSDVLRNAVARACALRNILGDEKIRRMVVGMNAIPTLPTLYDKVCRTVNQAGSSTADVSKIVSEDMAMTAKILHLVNSAFFGLRHQIENIGHAISLLGMDTIKALILTNGVFARFTEGESREFAIPNLFEHCVRTGKTSHTIAKKILTDTKAIDESVMAGMMHDLGKLILIRNNAGEYRRIIAKHRNETVPLHIVEKRVLRISHAEVGAYLLGMWGMSDPIVEAVAFHHVPGQCIEKGRGILTAVHMANAFCHDLDPGGAMGREVSVDMEYLRTVGVLEQLDELTALSAQSEAEDREKLHET